MFDELSCKPNGEEVPLLISGEIMLVGLPTKTFPLASITVGVASGFALSSTNKALPVPTCVMRRAADVELSEITALPVFVSVVPLNVKLADVCNALVSLP